MTNNTINTIGLIIDIIGIILLFKFGLPSEVSKTGDVLLLLEETNESEKRKWIRYNTWSKIGLGLIIIGFLFQIWSNY